MVHVLVRRWRRFTELLLVQLANRSARRREACRRCACRPRYRRSHALRCIPIIIHNCDTRSATRYQHNLWIGGIIQGLSQCCIPSMTVARQYKFNELRCWEKVILVRRDDDCCCPNRCQCRCTRRYRSLQALAPTLGMGCGPLQVYRDLVELGPRRLRHQLHEALL